MFTWLILTGLVTNIMEGDNAKLYFNVCNFFVPCNLKKEYGLITATKGE